MGDEEQKTRTAPSFRLSTREEEAALLDRAITLADQDEAERRAEESAVALVRAAEEVGVPQRTLERANEQLRTEAAERAARRRRTVLGAAITASVLSLAAATVWLALPPGKPAPVVDHFDAAADRWTFDRNPESSATASFLEEPGRGAYAKIRVERFGPRASDGRYFVQLDGASPPEALGRYSKVKLRVRGRGLPVARLYLEGTDERWRSPLIPVSEKWNERVIPLGSFERQERREGGEGWAVRGWKAPHDVLRLSLKLGHWVNDAGASGEVDFDDLRFE